MNLGVAVTYLILYNNLVPISLYVSLELVKVQMMAFVQKDPELYRKDLSMPVRSVTLHSGDYCDVMCNIGDTFEVAAPTHHPAEVL